MYSVWTHLASAFFLKVVYNSITHCYDALSLGDCCNPRCRLLGPQQQWEVVGKKNMYCGWFGGELCYLCSNYDNNNNIAYLQFVMCMCWIYSHSIADFVNKKLAFLFRQRLLKMSCILFPESINWFLFLSLRVKLSSVALRSVATRWRQRAAKVSKEAWNEAFLSDPPGRAPTYF